MAVRMKTGFMLSPAMMDDLRLLYADDAAGVADEFEALASRWQERIGCDRPSGSWDETDAILITYADSVNSQDQVPLAALADFVVNDLHGLISGVHLLPFYPYTSDDGFSVIDYHQVRTDLGDWGHVADLARNSRLAFDVVLNHASQYCPWLQRDLAGDPEFRGFAFEVDPAWDLSQVTRPRTGPLRHSFDSARGPLQLWTTFSRDQVDLNFRNPRVFLTMLEVMFSYIERGAGVLRLDALPYLWKESGSTCIHLPGTHAALRIIRRLVDQVSPGVRLLAETNAPFAENLQYWGEQGDGAHWLYDFTAGPLMLHALVAGDTGPLNDWVAGIPQPETGSSQALLHVTATHDGIGLRPAEGLLGDEEIDALAAMARDKGGHVGMRTRTDGREGPYEMNLTWFDAVRLPDEQQQHPAIDVRRFISTQAIAMVLRGVPGIYIHSLFGSPSDIDLWRITGQARSVNRGKLSLPELRHWIGDARNGRGEVFRHMSHLLRVRRALPALHPDAGQRVIDIGPGWFAVERNHGSGSRLVSVTNFSAGLRVLEQLPGMMAGWKDLITGESFGNAVPFLVWQTRWLVPQQDTDGCGVD